MAASRGQSIIDGDSHQVCFNFGIKDADFAGDPETRISTSGYAMLVEGAAISRCSQLLKCVSLSTTESEYVAACEGVKEIIWVYRLFLELVKKKLDTPKLNMDNQSAVKLIKNPEFHKSTKHIEVKYNFIRQKYQEGLFTLHYVPTNQQTADILTKPLLRERFEYLRQKLRVEK